LPLSTTKAAWGRLRETFLADDAAGFKTASTDLTEALAALPAAYRANARLLDTELRYNRLRPFRSAWMVMLAATALAAVAMGVRRRWFDAIVLVGVLAGFAVVTYGLSMRWQIAGRIPASNMFESLLFLGWGVGAFAVVAIFVFRERLVPLTAAGMSATALFLADVLPLDPFIRPIAPVLMDTVWMSIHVPVIMVSYSVLALAVLIAHVQLVVMAAAPAKRSWIESIDNLHYWYVPVGSLLLAAGIITGSMWAASSWGRYWGWDPKEVWSLVALLGYLTILHVRVNPERVPFWAYVVGAAMMAALLSIVVVKLAPITSGKALGLSAAAGAMILLVTGGGPFSTAAKSILCFWLIIMTYVGVNYVLGAGLHSYGFGTGAVARSMFRLGGGDLAFVALCCVVYLLRRALERGRSATSQVVLAT
jgi:ABC-type transport system involved in cytochrome c biogenesis permease subunit